MRVEDQKYLDLEALPEEARKELMDFYEFLISKHKRKEAQTEERLKELFSNPVGILPDNYHFDRDEAHER